MSSAFAAAVVLLAGLYLCALALAIFVAPSRAARFLQQFASSQRLHYLELCIRLVVGAALLVRASHMPFPGIFDVVGWVLILTTAVLFLVPWRLHRRFAERAVPMAIRHLGPLGFASLVLGGLVLLSVVNGAT